MEFCHTLKKQIHALVILHKQNMLNTQYIRLVHEFDSLANIAILHDFISKLQSVCDCLKLSVSSLPDFTKPHAVNMINARACG